MDNFESIADLGGKTIPLYEEVKRTIYQKFQEMSNLSAQLIVSNSKSQFNANLILFKEKFIEFYVEVNHPNKLKKLRRTQREFLKICYKHPDMIDETRAKLITEVARYLIEELGITKIEARHRDPGDAILGNY